jgi:hypothetical protein
VAFNDDEDDDVEEDDDDEEEDDDADANLPSSTLERRFGNGCSTR